MKVLLVYYYLLLSVIKSTENTEVSFNTSSIRNVSTVERSKINANTVAKAVLVLGHEICDELNNCFPNPCNSSQFVDIFPDPYDRTKFYICGADRQPMPYQCPEGTEFNMVYNLCEMVSDINCDSYQCLGLPDKTKLQALTTTQGYCECINNVATYHNCPNNGEFNIITEKCETPICDLTKCRFPQEKLPASNITDAYCDCTNGYTPCPVPGQKFGKFGMCMMPCMDQLCSGKNDQYLVPSTVNDNSFCVCHTGMAATYSECEPSSNIFDELKQSCVPNSAKLCGTKACTAMGPNPAVDTATGFCLCTQIGKLPEFKKCLEGIYDDSKKTCVKTAKINCDSYQCRGLPDKTKIQALTTTQGYCECINNVATYHNCPYNSEFNIITEKCETPICDLTKCRFPQEKLPAFNTTAGFCDCTNGYTSCPDGKKFGKFGMCMLPCLDQLCSGKNDQYLIPSTVNDNSFCVCHTNMAPTYGECPPSYVFDEGTQSCVAIRENHCETKFCTGVGVKPAKNTLTGFCLCTKSGDKPVFMKCLGGGIYDDSKKACIKAVKDVCDFTKCNFPNQRIPAANTSDGYCDCTTVYKSCPDGEKFGKYRMCLPPCVDQLCAGKKDHYLIQSTVNDHSFCVCHTTMAPTYEECESKSFVFNETLQTCMPNNEELCGSEHCTDLSVKPAKDTLMGFCLCTKLGDKPVFRKCLGGGTYDDTTKTCLRADQDVCDFTKCNFPKQHIPAANTTDGYCDCTAGYKPCPDGQKFGKYGMCLPPCIAELCTRKETNYVIESTVNDHSFCVCHTIASYMVCEPKTYIFDQIRGMCLPNTKELCGTEVCTGVGVHPAKDNLTGFCLCTQPGDKAVFKECLEGIYDDKLKTCVKAEI